MWFKRKQPAVGYRPKYIDYYGKPWAIEKMSIRHLRNAIKGFRRKGYVPTWEYQKGKNRPMGVLDFLIKELEAREDQIMKTRSATMKKLLVIMVLLSGVAWAGEVPTTEHIIYQMEHLPEYRDKKEIIDSHVHMTSTTLHIEGFVLEIQGVWIIKGGSRLEIIRKIDDADGKEHTYVAIEEYCGAEIQVIPLLSLKIDQ